MFQRILVPLDGSKRAEQALTVAVALARFTSGSILLMRVSTPEVFAGISTEGSMVTADVFEAERAEVTDYLNQLASQELFKGVETHVHVAVGIPAEAVIEASHGLQADIIVMSSRGNTGLTRWILGSVAQKIARHSAVPVLIARESEDMANVLNTHHPVRVLVALDGSPLAEEALLPAAQLSAALSAPLGGALHLMRVVQLPVKFEYGQDEALAQAKQRGVQQARAYLDGVEQAIQTDTLSRYNLQVTSSVAVNIDIADTLIQEAEGSEQEGMAGCDIMALATHEYIRPRHLVMGSVAERILGATKLPLLMVHTQKNKEQANAGHEPMRAS